MRSSRTAPAKINLFLDVLGRRADGYHDIRTVFLPLSGLTDTVELDARADAGISVSCDAPGVPDGETNTCWRAAELFRAEAGLEASWRVEIRKRIPVSAGLGGGSSDAACLLRMLNRVHGFPLPSARLRELAGHVGADVPFFLDPQPALAEGTGDRLLPVACGCPLPLLLVNPGFPVSAAWAYQHIASSRRPPSPPVADLLDALAAGDIAGVAGSAYNALEYAVRRKFPLLDLIGEALEEHGCLAAFVSGSGPTMVGLFASRPTADVVCALRARFGPRTWTFVGDGGALPGGWGSGE